MTVAIDNPAVGVRRLRIDRPSARNAIDGPTRQSLIDALELARDDQSVRAVLIGGTGGVFSAGGDLPSLVGLSYDEAFQRLRDGHRAVSLLWEFPKPVVVAVERFAVGAAAGLALLADDIVIGPSTAFILPFQRLGLIPDWGLSASVPLRAGWAMGNRLLREDGKIVGAEALHLGFADRLVADETVMENALQLAASRALQPQEAFGRTKTLLRGDAESSLNLLAEAEAQARCIISREFAEGYAAHREKREPDFTR